MVDFDVDVDGVDDSDSLSDNRKVPVQTNKRNEMNQIVILFFLFIQKYAKSFIEFQLTSRTIDKAFPFLVVARQLLRLTRKVLLMNTTVWTVWTKWEY